MSQAAAMRARPGRAVLDNLTLARKEGWKLFADAPARQQPQPLSLLEVRALSDADAARYAAERRVWHANLGPIRTPQLQALHEDLWDIVDSNLQDGDKAKGAVAVDAFPGLGKTTSVLAFARQFHQREIADRGPLTGAGDERLPVCRVGLSGNTGMKDFNQAMLDFYGHLGGYHATSAQYAKYALECVTACHTRLLIVDDLHFLRWHNTNGVQVSNHFKYIANEFPVTLLFVGVGLAKRGLFAEGGDYHNAVLAQTGRRTTVLGMRPFTVDTDEHRRQWRQLLLAIEQRIVLAAKYPGMLADDLSQYLFARSSGHIGSLMTLINRGCQRAIRASTERLDQVLLDQVMIDAAAEAGRRELETAFSTGQLSTRVR